MPDNPGVDRTVTEIRHPLPPGGGKRELPHTSSGLYMYTCARTHTPRKEVGKEVRGSDEMAQELRPQICGLLRPQELLFKLRSEDVFER